MVSSTTIAVVFALSCCLWAPVPGPPRMSPPPMTFSGSFELGQHSIDLSGVNTELSKNGAGSFGNLNTTIGGSGYAIFYRKLLIGGEGAAFYQNTSGTDAKARIAGGYGFFDIGLVPVHTDKFLIYPMLGIGGGGAKLRISPRASDSFVFGDQTLFWNEQPGFGAFALNLGVGAEYRLKIFENRRQTGGLNFSLRTGYIWLPFEADWSTYGFDIFGAPSASFAGTYAKVGIGLWTGPRRRTVKR